MTRIYRGGSNPSPKDNNMKPKHLWQIGDLVKIPEGKLGVVVKLHTKAGEPFYLIHETLSNRQAWYSEQTIANPESKFTMAV